MVATEGPLSEWADNRTEVISTPYKKSNRKQTKASQKNRDVNAHDAPAYPKLTVVPLAIMTFYSVSGGPFGVEPTIHAAGAFYTLLGFIIMPFVWCIPE
eukprot:scaffold326024_cov61-Attheya_sp.AAC.1